MSGLDDIRVAVDQGPVDPLAVANARAIMAELEQRLADLVDKDQEHSIDLRSLPMGPQDMQYLKDALGQGEVTVELNAIGPTRIQETAIHGIWWVTHYNEHQEVMAEFIEVTRCPDIIRSHSADVRDSLEALREKLVEVSE